MIFDNITIYLKRIFKTGIILLLIPLSFSVLCILLADKLDKLYGIMAKWPAELLGLCGMTTTYNFHESLILFYLFIILMNIFAISYCAGTAVDVLKHDERNGMIQFYINQPFTKVQIFIIKTFYTLLIAICQWLIYVLSLSLSLRLICSHIKVNYESLDVVNSINKTGLPILIFAIAISLLYSLISRNRMGYVYYLLSMFLFSLLIGNIYKILDLISYYMRKAQVNDAAVVSIAGTLKKLRILFPFTLLNPLNTEKAPLPDYTLTVYLSIGFLIIFLCGFFYNHKTQDR